VNLNVLHRRLLQDVLEIGDSLPLVITGGYAVQAHQLVDRLSRDIDVATDSGISMEDIAADVASGLTARGWDMRIIGVDPRSARLTATDPATGEQCELDILKEVFSQPPAITPYGPVLALYDVIGTKVRALAGRGLPRDLIDIHAASQLCSNIELEALGRRHAWDEEFSLSELKERLDGAEWYDDQAFAEYGLSAEEITDLRMWALAWADDIRQRSNTGAYDEDDEGEPV
jgi:predicted nucleotidyltransferase component of viral defense system